MTAPGPVGAEDVLNPEELSFEDALGRLEEIVEELEGGRMSLEDSLKRFEEGMQLRRVCMGKLSEAESRIEQVLAESDEGDAPEGSGATEQLLLE